MDNLPHLLAPIHPLLTHFLALIRPLLTVGCIVVGCVCVLRIALQMIPAPGAKLPHPSKVPGMPIAGPASPAAVHAALGGRRRRGFFHWLFKT